MIENFCDFIKKIHADPFTKITNLTVKEFYVLKDHLQVCDACNILVEEVAEKYKNSPSNSAWGQIKYN